MTQQAHALPQRDVRIIGLVGAAHFSSHFFQLVLPPLFPFIRDDLGVSYTQLGLAMAVFYAVSGLGQVAAGFLVDRYGPQRILPAGIAFFGLATILAGLAPAYWMLVVVAVVAALGNCVFHPADFSVMTARVTPSRLARAYSIHTVSGTLGWAAAPVTLLLLNDLLGWRAALILTGAVGIAFALFVATQHLYLRVAPHEPQAGSARPAQGASSKAQLLFAAPVLLCFVYFTLLSIAQTGMQSFLPSLMPQVQAITFALATTATTVYLVASATGSLVGGFLADRTSNHERIVGGGLVGAGVLTLALGYIPLALATAFATVAVAGFLTGITIPSRDMLVRSATPAGSTGKIFGFVYSGLDLGAMLAPVAIGVFLDRGQAHLAFAFMAAALIGTITAAFLVKWGTRRAAARSTNI
ncbi:MFS transporter [Chelatococcus composti]|uniref:MFS family permease n=1 Tax=Chelatococcus composti TaxID=1743235 RepID=A0A841KDL5_9HYPH|nr:MFS transporter [Chelatococcus composti]MBB6167369.1 MFS family permease [Chelatococcus composti]MBS7735574.1 MFS transporter [Chelatococcus composti]GGG31390.1 MFS transporter [Chelatococcus composti]